MRTFARSLRDVTVLVFNRGYCLKDDTSTNNIYMFRALGVMIGKWETGNMGTDWPTLAAWHRLFVPCVCPYITIPYYCSDSCSGCCSHSFESYNSPLYEFNIAIMCSGTEAPHPVLQSTIIANH